MRWVPFLFFFVSLSALAAAQNSTGGDFSVGNQPFHPEAKVPAGVVLVKGAWASASDSVTPVPEGQSVVNNVFRDPYFGITYNLPKNWNEQYEGPPPSDSGRYVLAQFESPGATKDSIAGTILISAQDMFFTPVLAQNALQLVNYDKEHLQSDYKLELSPTRTTIAGRSFVFYAYWSPVAKLHWYVLTTEIRCHAVEFVMMSRDTKLLESLVLGMKTMQLPASADAEIGRGGEDSPLCIADYAQGKNLTTRVDPIFRERSYNPVPVRIIIDKNGSVKHVHFLSALPSQTRAISDALKQWKFKPYIGPHGPAEVETGLMFGRASSPPKTESSSVE